MNGSDVWGSSAPKFESMGAQGASQQSSSRHARLRYSMKLSRQSISFHLKLSPNASAGTKECAESPTPVIEENHTSQVLVDIHTKTKKSNIFFKKFVIFFFLNK